MLTLQSEPFQGSHTIVYILLCAYESLKSTVSACFSSSAKQLLLVCSLESCLYDFDAALVPQSSAYLQPVLGRKDLALGFSTGHVTRIEQWYG